MKQIFLYTSLAVMALAVTTTGAAPERCDGTVQLTSQSNFQVRQAGRQTFVQFDFTGLHAICLADRSVVTGIVEGHLVQRTSANGDFSLTFDEVLSYNGGTLGYRGEGSLTAERIFSTGLLALARVRRGEVPAATAALTEVVGHPSAEHQEAAVRDHIAAEHPLQVLHGEVQVARDGRQRDARTRSSAGPRTGPGRQ